MKRIFGIFEVLFDLLYLVAAITLGFILLFTGTNDYARTLSSVMAFILAGGDAFHLLPRILLIITRQEEKLRPALGRGKQITSITMTIFYLLLWQIGLLIFSPKGGGFWSYPVYLLAAIRILLCLLPQNKWQERYTPVSWGIWRNVPFFLLAMIIAGLFFWQRNTALGLGHMWIAIILSFVFYLPVVLWSDKSPKIGMLMLPKTCVYLWMLVMCLPL